jgi:hypothetical protein
VRLEDVGRDLADKGPEARPLESHRVQQSHRRWGYAAGNERRAARGLVAGRGRAVRVAQDVKGRAGQVAAGWVVADGVYVVSPGDEDLDPAPGMGRVEISQDGKAKRWP